MWSVPLLDRAEQPALALLVPLLGVEGLRDPEQRHRPDVDMIAEQAITLSEDASGGAVILDADVEVLRVRLRNFDRGHGHSLSGP